MAINRKEKPKKGKGMKGMSIKSGDKRPTKQGAGLTAKGVAKYRRQNPGSNFRLQLLKRNQEVRVEQQEEKVFVQGQQDKMKKFPKAAKDPNSRLRQGEEDGDAKFHI